MVGDAVAAAAEPVAERHLAEPLALVPRVGDDADGIGHELAVLLLGLASCLAVGRRPAAGGLRAVAGGSAGPGCPVRETWPAAVPLMPLAGLRDVPSWSLPGVADPAGMTGGPGGVTGAPEVIREAMAAWAAPAVV